MNSLAGDQTDDINEPIIDPDKDYHSELVGEGKKFRDDRALARAKVESDHYIKSLTGRLDELREDYTKLREEHNAVPKLQELIDQMKTQRDTIGELPLAEREPQKPAIDPTQIESLVSSKIQEFQNSERQERNFLKVQDALEEQFGDNYQSVVKSKIKELGLTAGHVDALAKTSPQAALRLLGADGSQSKDEVPMIKTTQRSDNFSPSTNKRTWNFYQKMRKEQPDLYRNPKTQVQMHEDYLALGKTFEDGDFHH